MPPRNSKPKVESRNPATTCKLCGHPVLLALQGDTSVVLDERSAVYLLSGEQKDGRLLVSRTPRSYVAHEAVCAGAKHEHCGRENYEIAPA